MSLCFEQLSLSYAAKPVLREVSFQVPSASITALLGRNGAGKSSLIRCLMGEISNYRGSITLDGREVRTLSLEERATRLACLPQNLPAPHVTVEELISFGRTPYLPLSGTPSQTDLDTVRWAMDCVGLTKFKSAFVDTLSGGERKKAFFAMTLAQDTPYVILDEPTAHLDTISRFEFLALLSRMRQETGKTFLVVMHDLPEVLRYADRMVLLHQHSVFFEGSPEDCLQSGAPQRCFQIQVHGDREHGYAVTPLL